MKKYLIIRFSSIGDIVLTTPVIRCLKKQHPEAAVHYLTKASFAELLQNNPYVDKVHAIEKDIGELVPALKAENYDFIIDLHHNLRTSRLKFKLGKPSAAFPKLNFQKFLLTQFKMNRMPKIHIVDRYFKTLQKLNVKNDGLGLDFFIPENDHIDLANYEVPADFIAFSIGAQFATKRMTKENMIRLISNINTPIVLLGGPTDSEAGKFIARQCQNAINLCGQLNLNQSASVLKQAKKVICYDTGLMHIASAFNKPIISIWGNTLPDLGMYPYQPQNPTNFTMHEVDLKCRPCSKIGYQACPKKHFDCMQKQDLGQIAEETNN